MKVNVLGQYYFIQICLKIVKRNAIRIINNNGIFTNYKKVMECVWFGPGSSLPHQGTNLINENNARAFLLLCILSLFCFQR